MVPGALTSRMVSIPQVIIDAIDVVKNLQEDYLWVDSLCIVQDDAEVKHHQIAHMAIIYSSAILTLVAVGARDANSDLPGVRPATRWPREKQDPNEFNRPLRPDLVLKAIDRTVYVSRAWTFQERHLSRRCLYFLDEQMYFQCRMELWCEEKALIKHARFPNPAPSLEIGLNIMSRAPAWGESIKRKDWDRAFAFYAELIQEYSWKTLSFPDDIVNAFSGLLNALETHSGWSFAHGLPEQLIDWALLWVPVGPHQRRPSPSSGPLLQFPSWSWIGWIGPITFNLCNGYSLAPISSLLRSVELETFKGNVSSFVEVQRVVRELPTVSSQSKPSSLKLKNNTSLAGGILRFTAMTASTAPFKAEEIPLWMWNPDSYADKRAEGLEQTGVLLTSEAGLVGLFLGISPDFLRRYKWAHLRIVAISKTNRHGSPQIRMIEPGERLAAFYERFIATSDRASWASYGAWSYHAGFHSYAPMNPPTGITDSQFLHNIMLVQKRGLYYERVAVGQIYSRSWHEANPVEETILLV